MYESLYLIFLIPKYKNKFQIKSSRIKFLLPGTYSLLSNIAHITLTRQLNKLILLTKFNYVWNNRTINNYNPKG